MPDLHPPIRRGHLVLVGKEMQHVQDNDQKLFEDAYIPFHHSYAFKDEPLTSRVDNFLSIYNHVMYNLILLATILVLSSLLFIH